MCFVMLLQWNSQARIAVAGNVQILLFSIVLPSSPNCASATGSKRSLDYFFSVFPNILERSCWYFARINLWVLGSSSGTTKEILYYWVPAVQRAVSLPSFPVAVTCCREVALTGYCREQRAVGKLIWFSILLCYMQCSWVPCDSLLYCE